MTPFTRLAVLALVACAHAQYQEERSPRYIASEPKEQVTPVPILKQINRHNEDGSYTYGYEAADGSFKIETKSPQGEVKGKYGYKDDTGKLRVIEYGANKYGFQPAGEGITVAPPTLVDETAKHEGNRNDQQQSRRSQYKPAPAQAIDYDYNDEPAPPPRPAPRPAQQYRPQPAPQPQYREPVQQQNRAPAPTQYRQPEQHLQGQFRVPAPTPQPQYRPAPQSPVPKKPQFFSGAAKSNVESYFNPEPQDQYQPQPPPQRRQYQQQTQVNALPLFNEFNQDNPSALFTTPSRFSEPSHPVPRPQQPRKTNSQPYSMLDELLKEYALPANGANPLHDIVFGNY